MTIKAARNSKNATGIAKKPKQLLTALIALGLFLLCHVPCAVAQSANTSVDEDTKVNKKLSNPISTIWAFQLQENIFFIHPEIEEKSNRNAVNLQFQPVLPLSLTDDWNLITRLVFQVVSSVPAVNSSGKINQATGFGDTILPESETSAAMAAGRRA
ncbi:MAG: hypothetical protein ACREQX_11005 [Candidatus Binataceae bacterium]